MSGAALIAQYVKTLSTAPGVYRMLGKDGSVLYVGKARNLKARVVAYTKPAECSTRIQKMIFETHDMVVVETRTEVEALLLEANLIKSLKPKYNIIFRDDASYIRVVITHEDTPLIRSHRGSTKAPGQYFGPYPSATAVYATLDLMERAFRLRTCPASMFAHRTRPCLKYDIKRCSAPCVKKISPDAYLRTVEEAARFLHGDRTAVLGSLQRQMEEASARMAYEDAAAIRDRIKALSAVGGKDSTLTHALPDADVFALVTEGGKTAIQAFFYRDGQHSGNHVFYPPTQTEAEEAELFRLFLAQHYANRPAPALVCTNISPTDAPLLAEALSTSAGKKVRVETPQRGDKATIMAQAIHNATMALRRKVTETTGWRSQMEAFLSLLNLPIGQTDPAASPRALVECYDISNISGRFPVASCVVAGPEGMLKARYKRYTIRTKTTPDDYAMMHEVLTRRIVRGMKDGGLASGALPAVVLVDGGKGQLNVLVRVVQEQGLWGTPACPALVGIAKGEERDKGLETLFRATPGPHGVPVWATLPIPHNSALIFVLQNIRDEAHRFAITFHRETRAKALEVSRLNAIPGIGAAKKKALLLHFGSVEGIRNASPEALAAAPGIGPRLAHIIHHALRD